MVPRDDTATPREAATSRTGDTAGTLASSWPTEVPTSPEAAGVASVLAAHRPTAAHPTSQVAL